MEGLVPNRKIIHVDMDAFYASVNKWIIHALRGKPIAVGGSENEVLCSVRYAAHESVAISSIIAKKTVQILFCLAKI
jgi:DNA polymerase-4